MLSIDSEGIKDRLRLYIAQKRMKQTDFLSSIGVSKSYIGTIRKSISDDVKSRIQELYPDLNMDWLIYGVGNMTDSSVCKTDNTEPVNNSFYEEIIRNLQKQIDEQNEMIKELHRQIGVLIEKI